MHSRFSWIYLRLVPLLLAVAICSTSIIATRAQPAILTVRLLDRTYDVYNMPSQLIEIRGLNNRRPSDDAAALAVGEFSSSDIYKHAAFYSPHAGLWYLHTNVNNSTDTFAEDGGAGDVGIIGWDRVGSGSRAFIYDPTNRVRYLTNLYPAIQALDQNLGGNKLKGLRINRRGEMLLLSQGDNSNPTTIYKVSTNGTVTPLPGPVNGAGLLDINNYGQVPPMDDTNVVNSAINDIGDYAGFVIDHTSVSTEQRGSLYAFRNLQALPNSSGARPTSINNLGYIAASPGVIWGPDNTRTYLPEAMVAQDTNHVLTRFQNYTNSSYPTFINDAKDIVVGGYYLEPVCPEAEVGTTGATGFEVIDGKFAVRVGNRFKVTAVIYNGPKVALRNVTIGIEPPTTLFQQVGASTPPVPTTLQPNQTASSEFEWEVVESGTYTGRFVLHASGDCGPVQAQVLSPSVIAFVNPQLQAKIEATPMPVGISNALQVRITAKNNTTNVMTNVRLSAPLTMTGTGGMTLTNGPLPANYATLNAGASAVFTNYYFTTNLGRVTLKGTLLAQMNGNSITSNPAASPSISIQSKGDLLIKRSSESDSAYAIDNEYQANPAGRQVRTNTVGAKELSEFQVRIQNDEPVPKTFVLKIREETDPGWKLKYLFNNTDITTTLRATGVTLPQLASNATHTVTVQMTPTNALADDPLRVLLQLENATRPGEVIDIVEAVTAIASEIIVNSTGDEPDADPNDLFPDVDLKKPGLQTTLRCALDFANRRAGADLIKFAIPANVGNWVDGVPQIEPATALPDITETALIDGWTQNTNAVTPPVVLSGKRLPRPPRPASPSYYYFWPGAIPALVVNGENCELRGLVINQFPTGLELAGAGSHVVEGCFFGLNAAGTMSLGNGVDGGGTFDAMKNSDEYWQYAGSDSGYEYTPSFLDDRYVTWVRRGAAAVERPQLRARGWDVRVTSPQNRLGGNTDRQRNRFGSVANFIGGVTQAQNSYRDRIEVVEMPGMIWIDGKAAFANTVLNSSFGVKANESETLVAAFDSFVDPPNSYRSEPLTNQHSRVFSPAIRITDAPGTLIGDSAGGGNLFASAGIELSGTNCIGSTVFGNLFGVSRDGNVAYRLNGGIYAHDCGFVQIGGLNAGELNRFVVDVQAITLLNLFGPTSRVLGNMIGASSFPNALVQIGNISPTEVRGNTFYDYHYKALEIGVANNTPPASTVSVLDNKFIHDRHGGSTVGTAISIDAGRGHTVIGNQLIGPPDERLIVLKPQPTFFYSPESGPGHPIPPLPNDDFDLDSGPNNRQNWPVLATALLTNGQLRVQAGVDTGILSGQYQFHVYRCFADQWYHGQPQELVATGFGTADASGRAGFIATVPVGPVAEGDYLCATATAPDGSTSEVGPVRRVIGGADNEGDGVGNATENRTPTRYSQINYGDGNGDGVSDSQQANVTSLPVAASQWLTLVAPSGITFSNVDATAPSLTNAPTGYTFPLGFVSFTLNGLTSGGTVSVTNILHGSIAISNVFAFGPTPGNTQPHWYQLNFTQAADELRLSFTDGSTGDHDLAANGRITTLYAPAVPIPPLPQLSVLSTIPQTVTGIFIQDDGTNTMFTTNLVRYTRTALAWPASSTNYTVEYTASLSAPEWHPVTQGAVIVGNNLVVTNLSSAPMRFYRLVPGTVSLAAIPAPSLNLQRTSTNTFLLSWPSSYSGFALQQNTNLVSGNWTTVTNALSVTNGLNQVIVPPASGSRFFRLKSL